MLLLQHMIRKLLSLVLHEPEPYIGCLSNEEIDDSC